METTRRQLESGRLTLEQVGEIIAERRDDLESAMTAAREAIRWAVEVEELPETEIARKIGLSRMTVRAAIHN